MRRCLAIALFFILAIGGCASFHRQEDLPMVSLTSFQLLTAGAVPHFEIGLRIINPSAQPLHIDGLVYSVELEKYKVLTGVKSDLAAIPAYSEKEVRLTAAVDVLRSIGLVRELIGSRKQGMHYQFSARLDTGTIFGRIRVKEEGFFSFTGEGD